MLVLSRKSGEAVVVGDQHVVITILRTSKNQVRLGFVAPKEVSILRRELTYKDDVEKATEKKE